MESKPIYSVIYSAYILSFFVTLVATLMGAPWALAMLLMLASWVVLFIIALFYELTPELIKTLTHPKAFIQSIKDDLREDDETN